MDHGLQLFRDVYWENGVYYSCCKQAAGLQGREGDYFWSLWWDPKGNCDYDCGPEFRTVARGEVAETCDHSRDRVRHHKLRAVQAT